MLVNFLIFVVVALSVGLGSAWYAIDNGIDEVTVRRIGPWTIWGTAGRIDADPYTRAHFARAGRLPVTSTTARYYLAIDDSDGDRLDADCTYEIVGTGPMADWWSLAAYDGNGRLMANPMRRYTVTSATALRNNAGQYRIRLSRKAAPGNWLPVESDYRLKLILRVYRPGFAIDQDVEDEETRQLPAIRRLEC